MVDKVARKPRKARIVPLRLPRRIQNAVHQADEANIALNAFIKAQRKKWVKLTRGEYERDPRGHVEQLGSMKEARCIRSRWDVTWDAWLHHLPWATEDRVEADAKCFYDFVARKCRLVAPVIPLRRN